MSSDKSKLKVMISSTARDLPDHRKAVEDACRRMGMDPTMMEYLPAMDADAVEASLSMVDDADIYLGVFAYRYGFVPHGADISVTEMEYNHAVAKGKPRLIFFMHDDHPIKPADVETGLGVDKLKAFKDRVGKERVAGFFKSVDDLRAQTIHTLVEYRDKPTTEVFHYVSDIPHPPEVYIAHPYTLLRTKDVIGRQVELNLLTDWVAKPSSNVFAAHILNIVALGGMGKSAVTWKWFNDIAPQEMKPLAGRMWWSFYESDATFENFILRALAYVTSRPREEIAKTPAFEREEQLLAALSAAPYLIVLDGLERILIAYSGLDAARQLDDDEFDKQTANRVVGAIGLPKEAAESFIGQHRLRQCIDPRAGALLRKLAGVRASRILVSTRLYPTELQAVTGHPIPGSFPYFMVGLSEDDALTLWRAHGVSGSRDELLRLFRTFGNYPLLIKALAGEVANDRRAPGDFDAWRAAHRDFDPFRLSMIQARTHVLEYALRNLTAPEHQVLHTIAAFRMPATYDTLIALLVESGGTVVPPVSSKPFTAESQLDTVLASLEDRGLLGWDRRANRYDLHPIVRGVTWSSLPDGEKTNVFKALHGHFEAIPAIEEDDVNTFEDLTPAVELFHTLIGLGRYEDAYVVFNDRLSDAMHYRLSANRRNVELLEVFFPDGVDASPRLESRRQQSWILNGLAQAYQNVGEPGRSVPLLDRANDIDRLQGDDRNLSVDLLNSTEAKRLVGALYAAEAAVCYAHLLSIRISDKFLYNVSLQHLGLILASRAAVSKSHKALQNSLDGFRKMNEKPSEGTVTGNIGQRALWLSDFAEARAQANAVWRLAHEWRFERNIIQAARLHGAAALGLDDLVTADERLHLALARARSVNLVDEELPALTALAEMRRRQGNLAAARELLDGVWDLAERGPYPMLHADARNVLARVEQDAGNREAAVAAATAAYKLAWCDGPPYAYHWGLEAAKALLKELGAPEPSLPPFDPAKHPPMSEVEIEPTVRVS